MHCVFVCKCTVGGVWQVKICKQMWKGLSYATRNGGYQRVMQVSRIKILTCFVMRTALRDVGGGKNHQADNHSLGSVSLVRSSYEVITHLL